MRNFLSIILSTFYLALASSVSINMHYCGGELQSIKINTSSETCCCGSSDMSSSCCQDEELTLGIDIDQNIITQSSLIKDNIFELAIVNVRVETLIVEIIEDIEVLNYDLPPPKLEPIWLFNCSLTYYG
ncbi:hypothetical protein ACFLSE_10035 [Bacteroidota bacterium]